MASTLIIKNRWVRPLGTVWLISLFAMESSWLAYYGGSRASTIIDRPIV